MPKLVGKNERGFIDPISLIGLTFLLITLTVSVSVTNNPVKKFLLESFAKGGRVESCDDLGSPKARQSCRAAKDAADEAAAAQKLEQEKVNAYLQADQRGAQLQQALDHSTQAQQWFVLQQQEAAKQAEIRKQQQIAADEAAARQHSDEAAAFLAKQQELANAEAARQAEIARQQQIAADAAAAKQQSDQARIWLEQQEAARQQEEARQAELRRQQQAAADLAAAAQHAQTIEVQRVIAEQEAARKAEITAAEQRAKFGNIGSGQTNNTSQQNSSLSDSLDKAFGSGSMFDGAQMSLGNESPVVIPSTSDLKSNPSQYANCNTDSCNAVLTLLDKAIPDNYINYWQGQVAGSKPTDNHLDIAFNRGTTFDTINTVSLGSFEPYVANRQRINETNEGGATLAGLTGLVTDVVDRSGSLTDALGLRESADQYSKLVFEGVKDKETLTSTIKLGVTLTAEGAAIAALPGILTSGGLAAGGAQAFTTFGAVSTLQQTSSAAVAQIEDPGSKEAWKQTGYAAISWVNIATADKLIKTFKALELAKEAGQTTQVLVTAAQNARNANNLVSGINVAVDSFGVYDTCSQTGVLTGSCAGAVAAVAADVGFGFLDYKQGQLGFGDPLAKIKVSESALIGPLLDVKDPNGTRIATEAEINQLTKDPNEASALAIFDPSKITPDPGTIAQLTPSGLNSQIPNTPPHAETNLANAPNTNIADDIAKPLTGTVNTNTVDSPTTTNQSPTIASLIDENITKPAHLDDPNASVLDKTKGVIETLPDTRGVLTVVKKLNQIGDEIADILPTRVDPPKIVISENDIQLANSEIIGPTKLPTQTGDTLVGQIRADQANVLSKTGLPHPSLITENPNLYIERLQTIAKENGFDPLTLPVNPTTVEIKNATAELVIKLSDRYDTLISPDILAYRVGLATEDLSLLPANTVPHATAEQDIVIQRSSDNIPTNAQLDAIRIENEALEGEIRFALYVDVIDPDTNLLALNSKGGAVWLNEVIKDTPIGVPVTVIDIGLSDLKKVNDILGHDVGDKLLVESARIMRSTVDNLDLVGADFVHLKGKEYRLILPGTDEAGAKKIIEQITANIETARLQNLDNPDIRIYQNMGFDYGIAKWDGIESTAEFAKRAADSRTASEAIRKAQELEIALANPPRAPSLFERLVKDDKGWLPWLRGSSTTVTPIEKEIFGPIEIPTGDNLPSKIKADQASLLADTGMPHPELITKDPKAYVDGLNKVIDDKGLTKITIPENPTRIDLEIAGAKVERMIIEKFESFTPPSTIEYKSTLAVTDPRNFPLDVVPHLDPAVDKAVFRSAEEELQLLQQRTLDLQIALSDARYKDPMTGLYNKAGGDLGMAEIMDAAKATNGKVAIINIDVSGLGEINNLHGKEAGDQLLIMAADIFDHTPRRSSDIVFRVGDGPDAVKVIHSHGDEFKIILPGVDEVGARKVYERLYEELAARKAADPDNSILQELNFDAGIAHWDGTETIEQFVKRSDEAMYANKVARKAAQDAADKPSLLDNIINVVKKFFSTAPTAPKVPVQVTTPEQISNLETKIAELNRTRLNVSPETQLASEAILLNEPKPGTVRVYRGVGTQNSESILDQVSNMLRPEATQSQKFTGAETVLNENYKNLIKKLAESPTESNFQKLIDGAPDQQVRERLVQALGFVQEKQQLLGLNFEDALLKVHYDTVEGIGGSSPFVSATTDINKTFGYAKNGGIIVMDVDPSRLTKIPGHPTEVAIKGFVYPDEITAFIPRLKDLDADLNIPVDKNSISTDLERAVKNIPEAPAIAPPASKPTFFENIVNRVKNFFGSPVSQGTPIKPANVEVNTRDMGDGVFITTTNYRIQVDENTNFHVTKEEWNNGTKVVQTSGAKPLTDGLIIEIKGKKYVFKMDDSGPQLIPDSTSSKIANYFNPKTTLIVGSGIESQYTLPKSGEIEIALLHNHEPGYVPTSVDYAKNVLNNNGKVDPIKITEYNGKIYTYDGANRVQAYVNTGNEKIPYIFTKYDDLENSSKLLIKDVDTNGGALNYFVPGFYSQNITVSPFNRTYDITPPAPKPSLLTRVQTGVRDSFNTVIDYPQYLTDRDVILKQLAAEGMPAEQFEQYKPYIEKLIKAGQRSQINATSEIRIIVDSLDQYPEHAEVILTYIPKLKKTNIINIDKYFFTPNLLDRSSADLAKMLDSYVETATTLAPLKDLPGFDDIVMGVSNHPENAQVLLTYFPKLKEANISGSIFESYSLGQPSTTLIKSLDANIETATVLSPIKDFPNFESIVLSVSGHPENGPIILNYLPKLKNVNLDSVAILDPYKIGIQSTDLIKLLDDNIETATLLAPLKEEPYFSDLVKSVSTLPQNYKDKYLDVLPIWLKDQSTNTSDILYFIGSINKAPPELGSKLIDVYIPTLLKNGGNIKSVTQFTNLLQAKPEASKIAEILDLMPSKQWVPFIKNYEIYNSQISLPDYFNAIKTTSGNEQRIAVNNFVTELERIDADYNTTIAQLLDGVSPTSVDKYAYIDSYLKSIDEHYPESYKDLAEKFGITDWKNKTHAQVLAEITPQIPTVPLKPAKVTFNFQTQDTLYSAPENLMNSLRTGLESTQGTTAEDVSTAIKKISDQYSKISDITLNELVKNGINSPEKNQLLSIIPEVNRVTAGVKIEGILKSNLPQDLKLQNIRNVVLASMQTADSEVSLIIRELFIKTDAETLLDGFVKGTLSPEDTSIFLNHLSELQTNALPDLIQEYPGLSGFDKTLESTDIWKNIKQINTQKVVAEQVAQSNTKEITLSLTDKNLIDVWQGNVSGTCFGNCPAFLSQRSNIVPVKMLKDDDIFGNALFIIQPDEFILIGFDPSVSFASAVTREKMNEFVDLSMQGFQKIADENGLKLMIGIPDEVGGLSNRANIEGYITQKYLKGSKKVPIQPESILQPIHGYEPKNAYQLNDKVTSSLRNPVVQSKPSLFGIEWNGFKNEDGKFTLWPFGKAKVPVSPAVINQTVPEIKVTDTDLLAKKVTGLSVDDPKIVIKMTEDITNVRAKYNLPPADLKTSDPKEYILQLTILAEKSGVDIKPVSEFRTYLEKNEVIEGNLPTGVFLNPIEDAASGITRPTIALDPNFSAADLEHEFIHSQQFLAGENLPIEIREYEAYIVDKTPDLLNRDSYASNFFAVQVAPSSLKNYESLGRETPDWFASQTEIPSPPQPKPSLFGIEWNGFKNDEGKFTLWPFGKVATPVIEVPVVKITTTPNELSKSPSKAEILIDSYVVKNENATFKTPNGESITIKDRIANGGMGNIYDAEYQGNKVIAKIAGYDGTEKVIAEEFSYVNKIRTALKDAGRLDLTVHIIDAKMPLIDSEGNTIGYIMNELSDTTLMSLITEGKQGLTAQDIKDFKDIAKILDDAELPHGDIDPRNIAKDINGNWVLYDPIPVGSIEAELVIYRPITNPGDSNLPSYIVDKGPNITYSEDGQWLYEVPKGNVDAFDTMVETFGIKPNDAPLPWASERVNTVVDTAIKGASPTTIANPTFLITTTAIAGVAYGVDYIAEHYLGADLINDQTFTNLWNGFKGIFIPTKDTLPTSVTSGTTKTADTVPVSVPIVPEAPIAPAAPAKTSEQILQESMLGITNSMHATTPEELAKLFASIGANDAYVGSDGSLICGPLSLEILKRLGIYTGDVNMLYQFEPGTEWDKLLKAFPDNKFTITNTLAENHSIGDMKYWINNPLKVGDFLFLEVSGSSKGFDHMLVVDRVDAQGRAYSTTNHFTIINGVTTYVVDQVLLYDPTNPNNPDAMFNKWTDRSLLNVNGNTGSGGFLVISPKTETINAAIPNTQSNTNQQVKLPENDNEPNILGAEYTPNQFNQEFLYYNQFDYAAEKIKNSDLTWANQGCGLMVGAMVTNMTPYQYYTKFKESGNEITSYGTNFEQMSDTLNDLGYTIIKINKDQVNDYASQGNPIVVDTDRMLINNQRIPHFAEAIGVDNHGNYILNDPVQGPGVVVSDQEIDRVIDGKSTLVLYAIIKNP